MTRARLCLAFEVEGVPVPKARPRVTRSGHAYTPAETKAYEELIGYAIREHYQGPPLTSEVALTLTVRVPKKRGRPADFDNYAKIFCDAANGLLWKDDSQVVEAHVYVRRNSEEPGLGVVVEELG